jgi:hypothetical protein
VYFRDIAFGRWKVWSDRYVELCLSRVGKSVFLKYLGFTLIILVCKTYEGGCNRGNDIFSHVSSKHKESKREMSDALE